MNRVPILHMANQFQCPESHLVPYASPICPPKNKIYLEVECMISFLLATFFKRIGSVTIRFPSEELIALMQNDSKWVQPEPTGTSSPLVFTFQRGMSYIIWVHFLVVRAKTL